MERGAGDARRQAAPDRVLIMDLHVRIVRIVGIVRTAVRLGIQRREREASDCKNRRESRAPASCEKFRHGDWPPYSNAPVAKLGCAMGLTGRTSWYFSIR